MKFAVIGAGPSGLCAIRHCLAFGCEVVAFEQTDKLGGTWVYTDETDTDKNGLQIHSSVYQNLLTTNQRDLLEFPDFPFEGPSFMSSEEVLKNLNAYADAFDLRKHIRFEHHVVRVRPLQEDKWEIIVQNFEADKHETFVFDAVFVCRGWSDLITPKIPGQELFKGQQQHSHHYRSAKAFSNEKVLVVGGGPSGIEITLEIGKIAKTVYFSRHQNMLGKEFGLTLPDSVKQKPDVAKFTENGAIFTDGSFAEFSHVFYATGYDFTFPFLSVDCGISCYDKFVQPLYKHCININRPTMAFIALPFVILGLCMNDLQVRFCLTFMTGKKQLPTREEMLKDTEDEMTERFKTLKRSKAHFLGPQRHEKYYEDLATTAGIEGMRPIHLKMFDRNIENIFANYNTFRHYEYKIIDDENFEVYLREEK